MVPAQDMLLCGKQCCGYTDAPYISQANQIVEVQCVACSELILEQKKRALMAKEVMEQEHVRRAEEDRKQREATRGQTKARRIVEAQRAQQRAELDLQQKTAYFKVSLTQSCKFRAKRLFPDVLRL